MPTILEDNNWQLEAIDGPARRLRPFRHTSDVHILEQDYVQNFDDWLVATPIPLNTPHPDFPLFKLVKETNLEDFGNGVAKWTRVYAKVPATWIEMTTISYDFIGFLASQFLINGDITIPINGRNRFSKTVRCQVTRDYFMVGLFGTYTNERLIPIYEATMYREGITFAKNPTDYLKYASVYAQPTDPTREAYEALITSDITTADQWSIVAETSHLLPWMGNIWCVETMRLKAE